MKVIDNDFEIGEFVYLTTDTSQRKRLITAMIVYKDGDICYKTVCGTEQSEHFGFELSREQDTILTTNN